MTREQAIQVQIDEIMDNFDFRTVAETMAHLNWVWCGSDKPPSESDIRAKARAIMRKLSTRKTPASYFSGGFLINLSENTSEGWVRIELNFVLADWPLDGTSYDV